MIKIKHSLIAVLLFTFQSVFSQLSSNFNLSFKAFYGLNSVQTENSPLVQIDENNLQINVLKFYISSLELRYKGKKIFEEKNSFHLVDFDKKSSLTIGLQLQDSLKFDQLLFNLGIDSLTNVSGAFGGDLDPTQGMYWTWQSGYINFKLEGKSDLCTTRHQVFQFHLGGYQSPTSAIQHLAFSLKESKSIVISFDINKFLNSINLSKQNQIMSPGLEAAILAKIAGKCFSLLSK